MGDASDMHAIDRLRDSEARRLDLIAEIGTKRQSSVITYLTSTRPGAQAMILSRDIEIIEEHVRAARAMNARNLDLFLVTHGGQSVACWDLVAMVREYFPDKHFRVIVPGVAYSAGTAISLGADEIVMGPSSVLGPVDIQFEDGDGRHVSASDLQGFFDLVEQQKLTGYHARISTMEWLTSRSDAATVGALYRLWKENRRQIENMLDSRRSRLSSRQRERIVRFVLYGVGMHGQSIRRKEARANGISFITDLERTGVDEQVTELYKIYEEVMQLRAPLARRSASRARREGDENDFDAWGAHASETPIAMVESLHDTNPAYIAFSLRHWNPVSPSDADATAPAPGKNGVFPPPSVHAGAMPGNPIWYSRQPKIAAPEPKR